ncbi:M24 family metallopeptidase [Bradyrhizobium sp. CCBAU 11434]|uniref:M24 family metallopeptidase n=1 Tax=Bradyrhizobium sp. CCBAU 11434 TaxID=1630885 RepID=UPI0023068619|nr:Xaa-Pro peptidase family protein [Bradyrhizobium sp. CCBAU 11434]
MHQTKLKLNSAFLSPNKSALLELIRELGVDAIIAASPGNFIYAAGAFIMSVSSLRRYAFAVVPETLEAIALVATTERKQMLHESWIKDIRTYTEFVNDPADALADLLIDIRKDQGTIGIELDYLPVALHSRLVERLSNVKLVDISRKIAAIRAVKLPHEIAVLEMAQKRTHQAVLNAIRASAHDDSERCIGNRIAGCITGNGADRADIILGSGPNSCYNHARASDRVPLKSEIIRLDVSGKFSAWGSDFARTYSTGEPTALQCMTYRKLWDLQTSTINMVRPGMAAEDPFFFCTEQARKLGLDFEMVWVGHGLGVEAHEFPMIRPGEKAKLEVGMVFSIEPMVTDVEGSMYQLEDVFVVDEQGPRLLTLGFGPREIPIIGQPIQT